MAFVQAKCTNCGAGLKVDPTQDAAVCEHCGSAFIVEKAINNYNIANAQINAQTVNVNVGSSDFVIEGGRLKKYRGNDARVVIPDTVKVIHMDAFLDCVCVREIVVPPSVTDLFFYYASNNIAPIPPIEEISFPNGFIGRFTPNEFMYLRNINIGDEITAFLGNFYDKQITISKDLKYNVKSRHYDTEREDYDLSELAESAQFGFLADFLHISGDKYATINGVALVEPGEKGCYIATAVYGDYNAPQVKVLRRYRDDTLAKSAAGRLFVRTYYRLSPPIAHWLKYKRRINAAAKWIIDRFVSRILM